MAASFPAAPANPEPLGSQSPLQSFLVPRTGDVIDALPLPAADRLRDLRQRADDAALLSRSAGEAQHEAHLLRLELIARKQKLMAARASGGYDLADDAPQVIEVEGRLAKAEAEWKRLSELSDARSGQRQNLVRLTTNIEEWLMGGLPGGTALAVYEGTPPAFKGSITDAIESKRRRLRELRADAQ
jgi:hypothetical protein